MGTRGAIGFKLNDEYKVAYNHFDSYVKGGLGADVVTFINEMNAKEGSWKKLEKRVAQLKLVDEDAKPTPTQVYHYAGLYANTEVGTRTLKDWYCLLRESQGIETLRGVYEGRLKHIINYFDFLKNSLFCEYGYIINLDDGTFDFYRGYNKEPNKKTKLPFGMSISENGYYPCFLRVEFLLSNPPQNWVK